MGIFTTSPGTGRDALLCPKKNKLYIGIPYPRWEAWVCRILGGGYPLWEYPKWTPAVGIPPVGKLSVGIQAVGIPPVGISLVGILPVEYPCRNTPCGKAGGMGVQENV